MELNINGTPQTSSGSSSEALSSCTPNEAELEDGSECGWRNYDDDSQPRPIFYMGDDDVGKFVNAQGFQRPLECQIIRVGICAMAKKTNSKPMKEILGRLGRFEHLQIIVFSEQMITLTPVEEWPVVDALISFFSTGFPLQKAIQYKNLHKPFLVNDLEAQYALKDRREVYKILVREGIPHPRYSVMNRDNEEKGEFSENEDAIEVNGTSFQRPFVEKPVNAEDHNIYIYFPMSAGGGSQRLFRKVGSRSSVYSSISRVRKQGSFIYEDFMPTDGTDVKVYTVGPDYAHAEARKSPALDGKVERDKDGKEIRYPVLLTAGEKIIARKVCTAFKQNVCGFDLLRTGGKSYVCDVNGFSFVKNSTKYYDDCANVIGTTVVRALAPQLHIPLILGAAPEDIPVVPTTSGSMMELRCVIAIIRHGDRTPKQKMKMEVKHRKFFQLFEKYNGYKKGHLKLKKPKQLQEVLDIARDLLNEKHDAGNPEVLEKKAKLRQLKLVLEMYGHFSGINRKVQLKYQPQGAPKKCSSEEDEYPREPSLVLIVKWGGELTPAGKYQAEDLGKAFRTLYPGGQGEFETPGLGFLRLHSTFRHDLKIYASDEGRVQMTAAAFTKGLLALEGELTPILVSMVKSANTNGLLDKEGETSKYQHIVKERMMEILNQDREFTDEDFDRLIPTGSQSLKLAVNHIQNPRQLCDKVFNMVQEIVAKIRTLKMELKSRDLKLYHGESWELLIRRWAKLEKDFKLKSGLFDISKIPDIYDCIKYDLQHNQSTLQFSRAEELFQASKALADIVIPQEYGITVEEKLHISQSICTPLMRKIHNDLNQGFQGDEQSTRLNSKYSKGVASPERFVRTRLYFTSESHIHSLLNMLRYGGLCDELTDDQWKKAMTFLGNTPELNYMTQINIMMFEDPTKDLASHERFHVELHFSPGAYLSSDKSVVNPVSSGYRTSFLARQMPKRDKVSESIVAKPDPKDGVMQDVIAEEGTEEDVTTGDPSTFKQKETNVSVTQQEEVETPNKVEEVLKEPAEKVPDKTSGLEDLDKVNVNVSGVALTNVNEVDVLPATEHNPNDVILKVNETVVPMGSVTQKTTDSPATAGHVTVETKSAVSEPILKSEEDISGSGSDAKVKPEIANKKYDVKPNFDEKHEVAKEVFVVDGETAKLDEGSEDRTVVEDEHGNVFDEHFEVSDDDAHKTITDENQLKEKIKEIPPPHSPDPDIPEWDWGDTTNQDTSSSTMTLTETETHRSAGGTATTGRASTTSTTSTDTDSQQIPRVRSKPIIIKYETRETRPRTGSFESAKSYSEEKRSRSLEDHEDADTCLVLRYAMMEKHYRTIHLPINKDSHHSFSSLLYLNPEAFKAFDGFNMVPSLKPLETLHNNLTMRDMDAFLSRATTTKFFTPVSSPMYSETPLPSPKCPELPKAKSCSASVPSSGSSSAGPSSPLSATTPIDFISKLRFCISNAKSQQAGSEPVDVDLAMAAALEGDKLSDKSALKTKSTGIENNQKETMVDELNQEVVQHTLPKSSGTDKKLSLVMPMISVNSTDTASFSAKPEMTASIATTTAQIPPISSPGGVAPSLGVSSGGHQSAFKSVTRSSNQRAAFQVTQVSEEQQQQQSEVKKDQRVVESNNS